jgi:hypothetical protein
MVQIELFSYLRTVTEKVYLVKKNEKFANRVAIRRPAPSKPEISKAL